MHRTQTRKKIKWPFIFNSYHKFIALTVFVRNLKSGEFGGGGGSEWVVVKRL